MILSAVALVRPAVIWVNCISACSKKRYSYYIFIVCYRHTYSKMTLSEHFYLFKPLPATLCVCVYPYIHYITIEAKHLSVRRQ